MSGSGPGDGRRGWGPLLAVCAGYFMVILDVTVINVAVPVVGRELSASLTAVQWITDGYTLVLAGFLLTGGALGDRLGNRRVFCWGVAVFTASSAACAAAPNAPALVAARLVEGQGAALIVPGSLALLQQAYPRPARRARAFGLWGSMAGIAASAGPLLGGRLVTGGGEGVQRADQAGPLGRGHGGDDPGDLRAAALGGPVDGGAALAAEGDADLAAVDGVRLALQHARGGEPVDHAHRGGGDDVQVLAEAGDIHRPPRLQHDQHPELRQRQAVLHRRERPRRDREQQPGRGQDGGHHRVHVTAPRVLGGGGR